MKKIIVLSFFGLLGVVAQVHAVSDADIDKLTTYATVLGRATACGVDVERESARVGKWMDKRLSKSDQQTYLPIFLVGARMAAQDQASGESPESCSSVVRTFNSFTWP
ncbi:hypothetical protein [Alcaligenes sp. Lyrl_28]|uniref:hypothetical protein n=1 Tax=Alcaligenes sp. Lyrl_28 TaxID=3110924 RepID=UPI003F7B9403